MASQLDRHSERLIEESNNHPELFQYLPFEPLNTVDGLEAWYQQRVLSDPGSVLYAIIDKLKHPGEMAGIIGLTSTSFDNALTEIAWVCKVYMTADRLSNQLAQVMIFQSLQRTHVNTNACGILLEHCLDPPETGLGFRRVQWTAHTNNRKSIQAAQRLGFELEGVIRWARVLPPGKLGLRADTAGSDGYLGKGLPGRHTAMLSLCWDDWIDSGKRDLLVQKMDRRL